MSPSSFVFLNLAPTSSANLTQSPPRRPSSIHNHFLILSPTTSAASPPLAPIATAAAVPTTPTSTSRHNSIDFLSLAPISSPVMAPANVIPGVPRDRRSSSVKTNGSSSAGRFLKLSPVLNGREDDFAIDA